MNTPPALVAEPAEIRFSIEIKRAETGKVETFELVGTINPQKDEPKESECQ